MRDPRRIDRILAKVAARWKEQPDTRLCQLLSNEAQMVGWPDSDLFCFDDEDLENALDARNEPENSADDLKTALKKLRTRFDMEESMDLMAELGIHDRDAEIADLRAENERLRAALGSAKLALMNRTYRLDDDWEPFAIAAEKDIDAALKK